MRHLPPRRRPRALGLAVVACALVTVTACNDDGREMREPGPDQTLSIITTTVAVDDSVPTDSAGGTGGDDSAANDEGAMGHDDGAVTVEGFELDLPWDDGASIPRRFTCRGAGVSPELTWTGVPEDATELAVVVRTPADADSILWIVGGLTPTASSIREAARLVGALVGTNDFGELGWTAPCPDGDSSTLVRFELRALGQQLEATRGDPAGALLDAIDALTIATAVTTGIAVG